MSPPAPFGRSKPLCPHRDGIKDFTEGWLIPIIERARFYVRSFVCGACARVVKNKSLVARDVGIDFDELDLVLWSMKTGEILK